VVSLKFFGEEGTDGSTFGLGCWSMRRAAITQRHEKALLVVDQRVDVELTQAGAARHQRQGEVSRRVERRGLTAAILMISRHHKTMYGRF
jgi:hypothetical protein